MKIDCTVTENYMDEKQRMCNSYKDCYSGCLAVNICYSEKNRDKDMIKIVQEWSDLNPQRTYLTDLLGKYPNAKIGMDGTPEGICPGQLGHPQMSDCQPGMCVKCWNQID